MDFLSIVGRFLFACLFISSAWKMFKDFGEDGGPAAEEWAPKLVVVHKIVASLLGARNVVIACILAQVLGSLLLLFGNPIGAFILMQYLILSTTFLYDFYNYYVDEPEFFTLLSEFIRCMALIGALLLFIEMRYTIWDKLLVKNTSKQETANTQPNAALEETSKQETKTSKPKVALEETSKQETKTSKQETANPQPKAALEG